MTYDAPDLVDCVDAMQFIAASDRQTWLNVGNALKGEFGANALDDWLDWSASDASFNLKSAKATWRSFKQAKVPIGYIFKLAIANGYVMNKPERQAPSPALLAQRQAEREAREQHANALAAQGELEAIAYSKAIWADTIDYATSPYLIRKIAKPESCRYLRDGTVVVPMLDYSQTPAKFVGVQRIFANGSKYFPKGVAKTGSACRLGDVLDNAPILLCEGYATGLSIRMAVRQRAPVFVCWDKGNLSHVLCMLRKKYPNHGLIICADNDQKTKGNPGIKAAKKAIKNMPKADVIYPAFGPQDLFSSDFNDLHIKQGLHVVQRQLKPILKHYGLEL